MALVCTQECNLPAVISLSLFASASVSKAFIAFREVCLISKRSVFNFGTVYDNFCKILPNYRSFHLLK